MHENLLYKTPTSVFIKFHWHIALLIVYGCFFAMVAVGRYSRDCIGLTKLKIFTIWSYVENVSQYLIEIINTHLDTLHGVLISHLPEQCFKTNNCFLTGPSIDERPIFFHWKGTRTVCRLFRKHIYWVQEKVRDLFWLIPPNLSIIVAQYCYLKQSWRL